MYHWKRTVCLALCFTLLFSLAVGAANTAEFTDSRDIVHKTAVETVTGLKIMGAKENGCFDSKGTVTRAEMCKIICLVLNGGNEPQFGQTTSSYADVEGHWAAGFIEYGENIGFIAGRGDGTFDPDAPVTGVQAAKMLLVAIGFDTASEGFTGSDWAIAVNVRANQKGFYEGFDSLNPSSAIGRDDAAQMIYNALNAVMVRYDYMITSVNGELQVTPALSDDKEGQTLLSRKFNITP
ncbi:Cell surface protein [bioreactor metagenome]|uniref:Cell surface protein n=1 Tax=bioreactor metagenome TaxID=1076179 RepID=A0A644ZCF6_9ZZZZ